VAFAVAVVVVVVYERQKVMTGNVRKTKKNIESAGNGGKGVEMRVVSAQPDKYPSSSSRQQPDERTFKCCCCSNYPLNGVVVVVLLFPSKCFCCSS